MWISARQWTREHAGISVFLAYLLLTVFCFFPLVNGTASLNWDASDLWLPWKHFIAEEFYNGQLPLWNPYHVNGFPQHGDSMTWYPLSWLFAFLNGQYNLSALNQEYLFHIFIAGLAFYHFSGNYIQSRQIRFLLGLSYMFSGFMIGNAQHVSWIISAAWMPLVFHYLIQILKHRSKPAIFSLALCGFFFFSGGYLAIFFVALYIILIGVLVYCIRNREQIKPVLSYLGISLILISLLSLPLLLSAWNIFPLFNRFDAADPNFNLNTGSMPLNGVLSIVLPLASGIYNIQEISFGSFSAYLGLVPVLLICFCAKELLRRRKIALLVLLALFFLLCSMGDLLSLRNLISKLPLLDLFRYPALFRIFFIFFLLLAAGMATERLPAFPEQKTHRLAGGIILLILFSVLLFSWSKVDFGTIVNYFRHLSLYKPFEGLELYDRIFLNSIILLTGAAVLLVSPRKKLKKWLFIAWGLEIVLVALTGAQHTVYHPVNVSFSNELLSYQPKNYAPLHHRHSSKEQQNWDGYLDFNWQGKTFFLKQWSKNWYNPLKLKPPSGHFYALTDEQAAQMPLVYALSFSKNTLIPSDSSKSRIHTHIKNNQHIRLKILQRSFRDGENFVLVKQHFVPEWKAYADGREVKINQTSQGFMLIPIQLHTRTIELKYDADTYQIAFLIFGLSFVLVLVVLFVYSRHKILLTVSGAILAILLAWTNRERLPASEKISKPGQALVITDNDLDHNGQFRSVAYWKKHKELLLIQNYPKTDSDIAYFRHFYPERKGFVSYQGKLYARFGRGNARHNTLYSVKDTVIGNNFALDLLSLGEIQDKLMCFELLYKAPNNTPVNYWIAQLRKGQWVDGKTFPLACESPIKEQESKILLQTLDLSEFHLLPGDELRLYTWCDDPDARIHVQQLQLSTE